MAKVVIFLLVVLCVLQFTLAARIARDTPAEAAESLFDSVKKTTGNAWDAVAKKFDEAADGVSEFAKNTAKKLD